MTTFKEIGLEKSLHEAVSDLGFETPTPIQAQAIPQILNSDQDLIALAQTGTGKTAAFGLPVLQKMDKKNKGVQVIILCPIRELCLQITKDLESYAKNTKGVQITSVYGGHSIVRQISEIKRGANVIVGTPGRVKDLIGRRELDLSSVQYLVLDEADEMLDMGFKDELDSILAETPEDKQTLLFSATMPASVRRIANMYMNYPEEIKTGTENQGAKNVTHEYYVAHARDRYEALRRILDSLPDVYGILFCRTRRETQEVASKLIRDHYKAGAIHGDIAQAQRTQIMESFRRKEIKLLVATDVAARGIDVKNLTHIFNYNLPDSDEVYIHRSGRTGRAAATGVSISIINTREGRKLRDIERKVGKDFEKKLIPTGQEVCADKLLNIINKIKTVEVDEAQIMEYLPEVLDELGGLTKEALIRKFVAMELNYFLEVYKEAPDLNANLGRSERRESRADNFATFKINFGRKDKISVKDLLTLINSKEILKTVEIGRIQLEPRESYFELDSEFTKHVLKVFKTSNFKNKPIKIQQVEEMPARSKRPYSSRKSFSNSYKHGKSKRREKPDRKFRPGRHR